MDEILKVFNASKIPGIASGPDSAVVIVGAVIQVIFGILGIVLLVILLYAGTKWMTAEGDKAKVQKARDMITTAIIGLIIVLSAYAISYFVVESLQKITGVK